MPSKGCRRSTRPLDCKRSARRLDYKKTIFWIALAVLPALAGGRSGSAGNPGAAARSALGGKRIRGISWSSFFVPPPGEREVFRPEARKKGGFAAAGPSVPDRWFGRDKAQHFTVSFLAAGAAGYAAQHRWNRSRAAGVQCGFGAALSVGILKEIYDMRRPGGRASFRDIAADLAGAAGGSLMVSWW